MPKRKRKLPTQHEPLVRFRVPDTYRLGLVASGHLAIGPDPAETQALAVALLDMLDTQEDDDGPSANRVVR